MRVSVFVSKYNSDKFYSAQLHRIAVHHQPKEPRSLNHKVWCQRWSRSIQWNQILLLFGYTVSERKNATFSVAVFECFSKLKAIIQYIILIRKDCSFIIWNPIDAISILKLFITNQKRLSKMAIHKKCKFDKNKSKKCKRYRLTQCNKLNYVPDTLV